MQNTPNESPESSTPLRTEADIAFDAWYKSLYIVPFGKSGLRRTFAQGWAAARGEQAIPEPQPPASVPAYPLRKRPA